ncbi:hypothetical protein [Bifidobacterium pullorum]|uniref:hypothetical protein n=1 Tax=Bifidobacterium pullorum TaxID=78448 RepID=UPI002599861C|nr:hypothetical protein [uncultured Bifidobacterium sp.]
MGLGRYSVLPNGENLVRSLARFAAVLACAGLLCCLGACREEDDDSTVDDGQDVDAMMGDRKGERLASSLEGYIDLMIDRVRADKKLAELDPSGEATLRMVGTLERARKNGGVSLSDYENAWSDYRQCMLDRGYKEIVLLRQSNGVYTEASHKAGTAAQESSYNQDMLACSVLHVGYIDAVYMVQVSNPDLYANIYEGALDCLRRNGLVPKGYSMEDFRYDLYEAPSREDLKVDIYSYPVASCLVGNNIKVIYDGAPVEDLYG